MKDKELVKIQWLDAWQNSSEHYKEDSTFDPLVIISTGWWISSSHETITISNEFHVETETFRNICTIPKKCIRKIETIDKSTEKCPIDSFNEQQLDDRLKELGHDTDTVDRLLGLVNRLLNKHNPQT